jgi:Family of unknown function (DUF695)
MSILKNLLPKKELPISSYQEFWDWFQKNEKDFFKVVKNHDNIEHDFFRKLSPKLNELREGFFYLTGMLDNNTAELIITPDGVVTNIVFSEELVQAAPAIPRWKFTALKPALDIKDVSIRMADYVFDSDTLSFYSNDIKEFPDEIDITIVHRDFNEKDKSAITNGVFIFLDNFLGELNSVTTIDNLTVAGKDRADRQLIPIEKLKAFLIWREKEFIEKYEGLRHNTQDDVCSTLEAEVKNGNPLIAVINSTLLEWDAKASHPWILTFEMKYDGANQNGMPDEATFNLMDEIENKILKELKDNEGYLNIGRETADSVREIYFACKEFRKASKVAYQIQGFYADKIEIGYDIFKDKYWRSFNRYVVH